MRFFKKTSVAVTLTVLIVALCCVFGYTRVYVDSAPQESVRPGMDAGESSLNYYLRQIDDQGRFFSISAIDRMAWENLALDNSYNSLLAVKTTNYLNGQSIQAYAEEAAQEAQLGHLDLMLVLDSHSQDWYVTYGSGMTAYVANNPALQEIFREHLDEDFWGTLPEEEEEEDADPRPYGWQSQQEEEIPALPDTSAKDEAMLDLFADLEDWYEDTLPVSESTGGFFQTDGKVQTITLSGILSGILLTVMANLWWIVLALVALYIVDHIRFDRYFTKYPPGTPDAPRFHPFLFWHRTGSKWYQRRMEEALAEEEEDDFEDFDQEDWDPDAPAEPDPEEDPDSNGLREQIQDLFRRK